MTCNLGKHSQIFRFANSCRTAGNSQWTDENRAFPSIWEALFPELYPGAVQLEPSVCFCCFKIVQTIPDAVSFSYAIDIEKRRLAGIVYTTQPWSTLNKLHKQMQGFYIFSHTVQKKGSFNVKNMGADNLPNNSKAASIAVVAQHFFVEIPV